MKNSNNRGKKERKSRNQKVKRDKIRSKTNGQPEIATLETFLNAFYCKYAEISIYHARFCSKDLSDLIFVELKIVVGAMAF